MYLKRGTSTKLHVCFTYREFGPLGVLEYRVETSFLKAFSDKGDVESKHTISYK
jgi:hypothetical protein